MLRIETVWGYPNFMSLGLREDKIRPHLIPFSCLIERKQKKKTNRYKNNFFITKN
jgi:hypothetical protein